ncbi:MAG TPA: phage holin family protein [Gaiellaceae bacterium]|nr:phage holin family protein [Gaiellaceae bacterium]
MAGATKQDLEIVIDSLEEEFERLRNEAAARAQEAGKGAALIGTAGALGLAAAGALGSLPLLALRRVLPAWQIALLVAGGSAAGAVALARVGAARLAAIAPESLQRELNEAVENVAGAAR